ncbi:MAG: sigma-70 family RNA polymerase sigma factor [Planctomycetota bacterium]
MDQITQILDQLDGGDPTAAQNLLPLVYNELRKLAASKLSKERSDHTLQATALVHEAWLRIMGEQDFSWNSRGHFFGAAAEAMRRILIDHARASQAAKRGGEYKRNPLESWNHPAAKEPQKLLELDEALRKLEDQFPMKAKIVKLRFFAGMTVKEAAGTINISTATAERHWAFARAWLYAELR